MTLQIQYITDEKGEKHAVVIPFKQWEKFELEHRLLVNKMKVMTTVREGIRDVKDSSKNRKKLQSLAEFLNEG